MAVYDFGLTDQQFLKLTPLKFKALSRRLDARNRLADSHTARVCWAALSAAGAKKKNGDPFTPADLMPKYADAPAAKPVDMKPDEILAAMKAAFPGKKRKKKKPVTEAHGE